MSADGLYSDSTRAFAPVFRAFSLPGVGAGGQRGAALGGARCPVGEGDLGTVLRAGWSVVPDTPRPHGAIASGPQLWGLVFRGDFSHKHLSDCKFCLIKIKQDYYF